MRVVNTIPSELPCRHRANGTWNASCRGWLIGISHLLLFVFGDPNLPSDTVSRTWITLRTKSMAFHRSARISPTRIPVRTAASTRVRQGSGRGQVIDLLPSDSSKASLFSVRGRQCESLVPDSVREDSNRQRPAILSKWQSSFRACSNRRGHALSARKCWTSTRVISQSLRKPNTGRMWHRSCTS